MRLYEIDSTILELIERGFTEDCVDLTTGEIDEEKIQDYLTNLPIERDKKIDAYGCLIKNLTAGVEALKQEEQSLANRRKAKEKTIERLKANVLSSMIMFGERKKETTRVVFSLRKSESVEVTNLDNLPKEYIKEKIEYSPDKKALKEALESGKTFDGVSIVKKENLQIR